MAADRRELVFFDDFTDAELDRSKWNVRTTERVVNSEQQAYVDSPETVQVLPRLPGDVSHGPANGAAHGDGAHGALCIRAHYRPGAAGRAGPGNPASAHGLDFISGRIDTRGKVEFARGSVSARIKLPVGQGIWPAFWVLGAGSWPEVGEIDVMENVGEPEWVSMALHGAGYSGETPLVNRKYFPPGTDGSSWHVYSVDWTATELTFCVDGDISYRVTRPMVEHYGTWAFDEKKYLILNLAVGGTYPVKTNGARKPYLGIPSPTVDRIAAGHAVLLVDWVKVEQ